MTEWLILSLLVPALVAPAVLLLGFSGCVLNSEGIPGPGGPGGPPPDGEGIPSVTILSAEGVSDSVITLTWAVDGMGSVDHAAFERTNPDSTTFPFDAFSSPHDDVTGLAPLTSYEYVAHGADSNNNKSGPSNPVSGKTLAFVVLGPITQNEPLGGVDQRTVKCEIAVADLVAPSSFAPTRMWITLGQWGAVQDGEPITFSKVFIGHQAAGGDPWDATSLTQVLFGGAESTVIPPGSESISDEIAFAWDGTSALILSMFFAGGTSSDALTAQTGSNSTTHLKDAANIDEAATPDAAGYTSYPGYLSGVVKIEVA